MVTSERPERMMKIPSSATVSIMVDEADTEHVYTPHKPEIPRQWVPVAEHDEVLARLAKLEREVAELWSIIIESGREDKRTP